MDMNMDILIDAFLKTNVDECIQIQITERKENGRGVLFVDFLEEGKVDCVYIPFHREIFPKQYLEFYLERLKDAMSSILFFVFSDGNTHQMLELDIDSRNVGQTEQSTTIEVVSN